jgi:hypothetical protein
VARGGGVLARVLVRRGVTATDLPAATAEAEVDPLSADAQALLASGHLLGALYPNLIQMCAASQGF